MNELERVLRDQREELESIDLGETRDIQVGDVTVHCMTVTDWLLKK